MIGPVCGSATERTEPTHLAVQNAEGQRAFEELALYYQDPQRVPPYEAAVLQLRAQDEATRHAAAEYLLALLKQSQADESNGRAPWHRLGYWGGGAENPAREFRK